MNEALQDRIEDYLDGVLDTEESQRFEEQLVDDVVAVEFRELLLLRELLGRLPPDQPSPTKPRPATTSVAAPLARPSSTSGKR